MEKPFLPGMSCTKGLPCLLMILALILVYNTRACCSKEEEEGVAAFVDILVLWILVLNKIKKSI
jgi:hypothetical protein